MYDSSNRRSGYFAPLFDGMAYRQLVYNLMAFPLGLMYFLFFTIGLSLGGSLAIVLVGIPIILGVIIAGQKFIEMEQRMAVDMLGARITPPQVAAQGNNAFQQALALMMDANWLKGIVFLGLKFPLGIISFTFAVIALALPFSLIFSPIAFGETTITIGSWTLNTFPEYLIGMLIGVLIAPMFLRASTWMAYAWRMMAEQLLGQGMVDEAINWTYDQRQTADYSYDDPPDYLRDDAPVYDDYEKAKRDHTPPGFVYDPYSDTYKRKRG